MSERTARRRALRALEEEMEVHYGTPPKEVLAIIYKAGLKIVLKDEATP